MTWFRIITRGAAREAQHVLCDADQLAEHYPLDLYYPARALERAPGEADLFRARKLMRDEDTAARIAREGELNQMTRAEFADHLLAQIAPKSA